jgi:hypothetical protein
MHAHMCACAHMCVCAHVRLFLCACIYAHEHVCVCLHVSQLASRIFAGGLKDFLHEPEFLFKYLDFLFYTHDFKNMRVAFEKVPSTIPNVSNKR